MPSPSKIFLIFEAHADDCAIGMGGTVLYLADQGLSPVLITVTKGETAYTTLADKNRMSDIRRSESQVASELLRIKSTEQLIHPCQGLQNDRETFQEIVGLIRKYQPRYIFTHNPRCSHRDHRNLSALVEEAWWKAQENVLADFGAPYRAEALFFFEVVNLFPKPSIVIDITLYFTRKLEAIRAYKSQYDVMPGLEDYITGLALTRGYACKCKYGEAFVVSDFIPKFYF